MNLLILVHSLPPELVLQIRNMTYKMITSNINKELLLDINHYYKSKKQIINMYYNIYDFDIDYFPERNIKCIVTDIENYLNQNYDINIGFVDKFFKVLLRSQSYKSKIKIINIFYNNSINTKRLLNIYWGLLNINEREELIKKKMKI